ncbi:MAG: DUF4115 domain-containing protein [Actinomycetota bacterium]|nr:DUF4115 domain-containing protein [Actinomycetota bacterium]
MSSLGETLRDARKRRGMSLIDVEGATKLRGAVLEALEKGDFEYLPAAAYVRGYIISYAQAVDIDPVPLLDMYVAETGTAARVEPTALPAQVVTRREHMQALPSRTVIIAVIAVLAISVVLWVVGRSMSEPEAPLPLPADAPTETVEPSNETTLPGVIDTEAPVDGTVTTVPESGEPFVLKVHVNDAAASWLRVTVDGLKAYEGTLAGGQSKEWEVSSEAEIRIGKLEAVTVTRDGSVVDVPNTGDIPTLILKADE